jgi:hypothetical protein
MMTLDGKKTYITAALAAMASFALAMGWLTKEQYQVILGLLGSLGLATLRSGLGKSATGQTREAVSAGSAAVPEGAKSPPECGIAANG